ncbi:MAG: alpha-L-fucosidase [Lachnospirales bacterium]
MQEWFKKAKLGIFIHYGIYSVGDVSESWSFHNGDISYKDYMKQLDGFTAEKFDANYLANLFKKSGAKYAVLTAKHHDGVSLFNTSVNDLTVLKKTPAKRDIIEEYTKALREQDLKVGIYFSLIDWSSPYYRTVYGDGTLPENYGTENPFATPAGDPEEPEKWEKFLQHNNTQMKELMTNYGKVDLLWFDGDWERSAEQWKMAEFKKLLCSLNPDVICNSRMQGYGDYETPELGIPVVAPKGYWEYCTPINTSWGYRPSDNDYKTPRQIIRMFCDCITLGGNMLLDIGPKPDGTIDERQEEVLLSLGEFIHNNSEAIYETEKGLDYNFYLGGSTISPDKKTIYLFVYDKPIESVCLKGIKTKVKSLNVLHSGKALNCTYTGGIPWSNIPGTMWIELPEEEMHKWVTVIKIQLEDTLELYYGHGIVVTEN